MLQPGRRAPGRTRADKTDADPVPREQEMGNALRSVYQRAVDEKIPDEMLDLLGKLG